MRFTRALCRPSRPTRFGLSGRPSIRLTQHPVDPASDIGSIRYTQGPPKIVNVVDDATLREHQTLWRGSSSAR